MENDDLGELSNLRLSKLQNKAIHSDNDSGSAIRMTPLIL